MNYPRIFKFVLFPLLVLLAYVAVLNFLHKDASHGYKIFFFKKNIISELRFDFLAYSAIIGFLIIYLVRRSDKYAKPLLVSLILVLALTLNLFISRPTDNSWTIRLISNLTSCINPFYSRGLNIAEPADYPREHRDFAKRGYLNVTAEECRLTTYPPGLPLWYYSLSVLSDSLPWASAYFYGSARRQLEELSEDGGFDIPLDSRTFISTSCYAVILSLAAYLFMLLMAYLLALLISDAEKAAYSLCFLIFMPSIQMFSNTSEIFFPGISILIIYLLVRGLIRNNGLLLVVSGILLIISLFFTYALLPLAPVSFMIIFFHSQGNINPVKSFCGNLTLWISGLLFSLGILFLNGYDSIEMCRIALGNNSDFYNSCNRTIPMSLPLNLMEIFYFTGFIVPGYYLYMFYSGIGNVAKSGKWHIRLSSRECILYSFGIVLAILLISGGSRGEVARNWLSLIPFIAVSVGTCGNFNGERFKYFGIAMLVILAVISSMTEVTFCFWI
jgi:hypothetical protein